MISRLRLEVVIVGQDEIGTPFCITVDGETAKDNCVTVRDRDTLQQDRVPVSRIVDEITARLKA
jgi:glycyl-tRNA synthetase